MTIPQSTDQQRVAAIIVTYNRCDDLQKAIAAQFSQTYKPEHIFVINNNSNDHTEAYLQTIKSNQTTEFTSYNLPINIGGAGGFHIGLKEALKLDLDRFWLIDDDGIVSNDALEKLILASNGDKKTYASVATSLTNPNKLCWPKCRKKAYLADLNEIEYSNFAPFLGFFIHRQIIEQIGLPNPDYFISGDDYEYSLRLKKINEAIYWVKSSLIQHPEPIRLELSIFGVKFRHLKLLPWRHFYDTRNRIWTARKHATSLGKFLTIISILIHTLISAAVESNKIKIIGARIKGIHHGLFRLENND
jgi:GT2 family glycosyltransferase